MANANDFAQGIVNRLASGRQLETVKLQKLIYFIQGWSLAMWNRPAFGNRIEAWKFGPVIPDVYRYHARQPFVREDSDLGGDLNNLSESDKGLVEFVLANYGSIGAFVLADYTHQKGSPWYEATFPRSPEEPDYYAEITNEMIEDYFRKERNRISHGGMFVPM